MNVATNAPPRPTFRDSATEPLRGVALLVRDGVEALRSPLAPSWRTLASTLFVVLVVLDLLTTQWMMRTGEFEEANPVALAGMEAIGLTAYVCLASLVMSLMAVLLVARPRHYGGWVAQGTVLAILTVKAQVVGNNLVLLLQSLT